MKLFRQFSTAIISIAIAISPTKIALTAEIEEIAELAQEITVKVSQTDGAGNGSGVIFERQNNTYFVLTNRHVIVSGYNYQIQTTDGQTYPLTTHKEISGLDLMVVKFDSDRQYELADLGDSQEIRQLQTVYVAGFPGRQDSIDIIDGKIRRINNNVLENPQLNEGYAVEYTNETFPGSSGGAVLDDEGRLIGINGQSEITVGGIEIRRGIPIHFFTSFVKESPLFDDEEFEAARNEDDRDEDDENENRDDEDDEDENRDDEDEDIVDSDRSEVAKIPETPDPQDLFTDNSSSKQDAIATNFRDDDLVNAVAISLDGGLAITGGWDRNLKVWNMATKKLERTLEGHRGLINSIAMNASNQIVISGSDDGTVKVWNWQNWELKKTLEGHDDIVNSVAISADGSIAVSGSDDETIRIWNINAGKSERTLEGHDNVVSSVAISPDGNTIVSGSWDKTIKVWDWKSWELKYTLEGHDKLVSSVAITPDGQTVVSGSDDGTVRIWNLRTGTLEKTLEGHDDIINTIAVSADGETIISGSDDLTIKVWDLPTGRLKQTLKGHYDFINSVAVSANGQTVVSGSDDETIKLWQLK